jgi:hypothetical protein
MTNKELMESVFPQHTQVGGNHYTKFHIQPYEFMRLNNLNTFQSNVIKYAMRYLKKGGEQDIDKIIHYCELEKKILRDLKRKK